MNIKIKRKSQGKYPEIPNSQIESCIGKLEKQEFDTKEFIEVWGNSNYKEKVAFSHIGTGWQKMVGKNLSRYHRETHRIDLTQKRRKGAAVWIKK